MISPVRHILQHESRDGRERVREAQREGGENSREGTTEGRRQVVRESERETGTVEELLLLLTSFIVHSCIERD